MTDPELLRQFRESRSETAFSELVGRHCNLVHATALRLVGDAHQAKDVAQLVFIELSRKPQAVRDAGLLAGWLYRTTRFTAANYIRAEQRRRHREADVMQLKLDDADAEAAWQVLAPHLDDALDSLGPRDLDAVVLRFFESRSLREVGNALGITEDAAQKCVTRALEKLRGHFARRGMATSSAILASVLTVQVVQNAPAGMAAAVAAAALSASTAGTLGPAAVLASATLMSKTKAILVASAVLIGVGTPVLLYQRQHLLRQEDLRLTQTAAELATSNQWLQAKIYNLESNLRAAQAAEVALRAQAGGVQSAGAVPGSAVHNSPVRRLVLNLPSGSPSELTAAEADTIQLKKANLAQIHFQTLNDQLELTGAAKDLLQLTAQETEPVSAALSALKQRIHAHDLAAARQSPVEEATDPDVVRFLKERPGRQAIYRIPPFKEQEQQLLRDWFDQTLRDRLGAERTKTFVENSRAALDFWLGGTEDKLLAFVDRPNDQGTPVTAWMIKFNTPSANGTYSAEADRNGVPPQFNYLFEIHQPKP